MVRKLFSLSVVLVSAFSLFFAATKPWDVELAFIEACSCELFCTCYFTGHPSHQATGAHNCNFNIAAKVNRGRYGSTDLAGVKFWMSGDLGHDLMHGRGDRLILTFDPAASKEQREGVTTAMSRIYPLQWNSVTNDESSIAWEISPDGKRAHAKLANGKGEVTLTRYVGRDPRTPTEIRNLKYFGADWNSPFSLYYSDHYYSGFGQSYRLEKAAGFTIILRASGK